MLKLIGFLASLIPFAGVLFLEWLSNTRKGQSEAHVLSVFACLFLLLGIAVHSIAPLFLFDVYFNKSENRNKKFLLCIAPGTTILVWVCI